MLLLTIVLSASSPALGEALDLVKASRFEEAAPLLTGLLYPLSLDKAEVAPARIALAKCHFYAGQLERARSELHALLRKAPKQRLDSARTAPDFYAFFEETREAFVPREPRPKPAAPATTVIVTQPASTQTTTVVVEAPRAASAPVMIVTKPEYEPAPLWVRWMPLGIGQFANRDYVGSAVFVSLSVALLAANVAFAVIMERQVGPTGKYAPNASAGMYWAQQGTAGAFYASLIAGTIDALVFSPNRARSR